MHKSEDVGKSACNLRSRMEDAHGPSYYPVAYLTGASIVHLVVSEPASKAHPAHWSIRSPESGNMNPLEKVRAFAVTKGNVVHINLDDPK